MSYEKRNENLDAVRGIAILLVVFTHTHEQLVPVEKNQLISFFYSIDRIGVSLFFMLIGTYSFRKSANNPVKFIFPRVFKFIFLLVFWGCITAIVSLMVNGNFTFGEAIKIWFEKFNTLYPDRYIGPQFWFMYSIVSVYVLLPFFSLSLKNVDNKDFLILLAVVIVFSFSSYVFGILLDSKTFFFRSMLGEPVQYICYVLCGNYIIERVDIKRSRKFLVLGAVLMLMSIGAMNFVVYMYNGIPRGFFRYSDNVLLLTASVGMLMMMISANVKSRVLSVFAQFSFPVYLIHYIFLVLLKDIGHMLEIHDTLVIKIPLLYLSVLCCSLLASSILNRYKITGFLIK